MFGFNCQSGFPTGNWNLIDAKKTEIYVSKLDQYVSLEFDLNSEGHIRYLEVIQADIDDEL